MNYLAQRQNTKRNAVGLSIAALLHVLLIYGLINGLGTRMIDVIKGPLETQIIPQSKPQITPPPPPPQVRLASPPPPYIPPPMVEIAPESVANNAITAVATPAPKAPVAFAPVVAAPAVPDTDVSEVPIGGGAPVYPQEMMDQERQGSALVECTVGTDGRTSACQLLATKGGSAFGVSALQFAETQTYRPAMHDGVAMEKRKRWNLEFSLN